MTIRRLPLDLENVRLDSNVNFLHELSKVLNERRGGPGESPTMHFLSTVRAHISDGCVLLSYDEEGQTCDWNGDLQLSNWIQKEIARYQQDHNDSSKREPFTGYDPVKGYSYLVTPVYIQENCPPSSTYLALWRIGRLFYDEDLLVIKIALSFYLTHYNLHHNSSMVKSINQSTRKVSKIEIEEKRFEDALNSVNELVVLCQSDGGVVWYNKLAIDFFSGAASSSSFTTPLITDNDKGYSWLAKVIHPDDVRGVMSKVLEIITSKSSGTFIARFPVKSTFGRYERLLCRMTPISLTSSTGDDWTFTAIGYDDTLDLVKCKGRTMEEYMVKLIQDLRVPLTSSLAAISKLKRGDTDDLNRQEFDTLQRNWIRMITSVNNAFVVTEKADQTFVPTYENVCLEKVIDHIILMRGPELLGKDVDVIVEIEPTIPRMIRTDELRMKQIICNIISKALQSCTRNALLKIKIQKRTLINGAYIQLESEGMPSAPRSGSEPGSESQSQDQILEDDDQGKNSVDLEGIIIEKLVKLLKGRVEKVSENHQSKNISSTTTIILPLDNNDDDEDDDKDIEKDHSHRNDNGNSNDSDSYSVRVGRLEYQTRETCLQLLGNYIRSLRSSRPINIYSCSLRIELRKFCSSLFIRIQGLNVYNNSLEELELIHDAVNVIIIDSLDSTVALWVKRQSPEILKRVRFIVLRDERVENLLESLEVVKISRPLITNHLIRAVHDVIIRLSLAVITSSPSSIIRYQSQCLPPPSPLPSSSSPLRRISRNLAESHPLRILVVEDSIMNLQVLVKTLAKFGYSNVLTAYDGKQGYDLVAKEYQGEQPVELVFMDMQMPVLNGCEASMKIREYISEHPIEIHRPGPHIVAMTANSFSEDRQACLRSGMCCFAGKPVQWEHLEQIIIDGYSALKGERGCRCRAPFFLAW